MKLPYFSFKITLKGKKPSFNFLSGSNNTNFNIFNGTILLNYQQIKTNRCKFINKKYKNKNNNTGNYKYKKNKKNKDA